MQISLSITKDDGTNVQQDFTEVADVHQFLDTFAQVAQTGTATPTEQTQA